MQGRGDNIAELWRKEQQHVHPVEMRGKGFLIQDLDSSFNSNLSFPNPRGRCVAYLLCSIPIALMAHIQNLEAPCKADAIRIEDLATQYLCQSRRTVILQ